MKRILCKNCGNLFRPSERLIHEKSCSGEKGLVHTKNTEAEMNAAPSKKQKLAQRTESDNNLLEKSDSSPKTQDDRCGRVSKAYCCDKCGKAFSTKFNCDRHGVKCSGTKERKSGVTACGKCRKVFCDYRTRLRHEKKCKGAATSVDVNRTFQCAECGEHFSSARELIHHEKTNLHNKPGSSSNSASNNNKTNKTGQTKTCRMCGDQFTTYKELYNHRMIAHKHTGSGKLQSDPWTMEIPPWVNEDGSENERMRRVYVQHRHLILRERVREGDVTSSYNFPIANNLNLNLLMEQIECIYERSQYAFKVNISFGLILQNISDGSYRYFVPYRNEMLFMFPQVISNRSDIEKLRRLLSELDLSNYFQKAKPDSKWKPVAVVNCFYQVYKLGFHIGLSRPLPDYITHSKSIISFANHPNTNKPFADDLCFFRCLAFHQTRNKYCETLAKQLHSQWDQYVSQNRFRSSAITLQILPDLETCFETNINVFELSEDKTVTILYKTREFFHSENSNTMNINLFEDHFSYISKFNSYALKFRCTLCDKLFKSKWTLVRHQKTCENATKLRFPGGYFDCPKTIFDKLSDLGINVEPTLKNYPWFITFDMEAMLKQTQEQNGDHLTKTSRHEPISVSICSNVDGYTDPKFILEEDLDTLLSNMISYLNEISEKVKVLAYERWRDVFSHLNRLEGKWLNESDSTKNGSKLVEGCDTDSETDADDDDDDDECEAREINECEPPTREFLHAISKENVFYRFLKDLESTGKIDVQYNVWNSDDADEHITVDSTGDPCSGNNNSNNNNNNDDDDDGDYIILPFRPLNGAKRSHRILSDVDDDETVDAFENDSSSSSSSDTNSESNGDNENGIYQVRRPTTYRTASEDENNTCGDNVTAAVRYPQTKYLMSKLIRRTREQFETYCHQVPVLGYNSAKYDLNLLKTMLAKRLKLHEPKQQKFVVKKNNAYICLSNPKLRFLDMVNYLPPGTSYDKFLSTFGVSQRKSYFPYEYFTNLSVLDENTLPPKEAFYSSLKQCNVLEDPERVLYDRLIEKENKTEKEAMSILKLKSPPLSTIDINYKSLLSLWEDNQMSTMRDYLEHYNNLDVLPMVEGVEKFKNYFVERGIDVFKDCISVPGSARKMLYQSGSEAGASFALICKQDEDLYHTIKSNIVGGPSIIFTRYQEAGETYIKDDKKMPCKSILGYDANGLYVYSLGKPMPCGNYIRRHRENDFKPKKSTNRYTAMYDWMEWLNFSQNANIKHKMNYGYEKRVGPYLADGFNDNDVIFEFFGCYFHGHSCIVPDNTEKHKQRFARTQERLSYLRSQGYEIISIWECEFRKQVERNEAMKVFIDERYPSFYRKHKTCVTESRILDAIVKDELFGFIEVDIQVPESWDQVDFKPDTLLNPKQYFEEMSPLFCTTEVDFESIGEHMQQHVQKHGLSTKPRALLVGGMKAECLLISSPLLKWYIEHGLLITKIHQVVEFSKLSCFKNFVDNVTNDRRQGDVDKSQELKSSLSKLVGVSAFGGTIINQEKFQKIKYVEGFKKACLDVNNPRFRQINELGEDVFESEFANANISINSPLYLGYMILQYAKLHMLSFYYDFLLKFVGEKNFEMAEMDTDSCYFGVAAKTLRDVIKPEMLSIFDQNIYGNCRDDFTGDNFSTVCFPRECCQKHNKHDLRTPGLMKLEFYGTKIIGLCSKSYIAVNEEENSKNIKYSLKGANKQFSDPTNLFQSVLETSNPVTVVNRGIRTFDTSVFTYLQPKQAFNYFYCKRLVQSDGIHTKPLDIVLRPMNKFKGNKKE